MFVFEDILGQELLDAISQLSVLGNLFVCVCVWLAEKLGPDERRYTLGLDSGHGLIPGLQGHNLPESGCLVRPSHGCSFIDGVKYSGWEHLHACLRIATRQKPMLTDARQFCFRNCRLRFVVFFVERGNGQLRHW